MKSAGSYWWLVCLLALASCDPDKEESPNDAVAAQPTVTVKLNTTYNDQPFAVGAVYNSTQGYRIRTDIFKNYFSDIQLRKSSGEYVTIKEYDLVDFATRPNPEWSAALSAGTYDSLIFCYGLPKALNVGVDPATYPNSNPLSVAGSAGLFWNWNSGYIFMVYEGKADLSGSSDAALLDPFAMHCGDTLLYRRMAFPLNNLSLSSNDARTLQLDLRVDQFLNNPDDPIDISTDYLTHTSGNMPLAKRVVSNWESAIELRP